MSEGHKFRVAFNRRVNSPDEWDRTIIAVSPYRLKDLVLESGDAGSQRHPESIEHQNFKIRLAHSTERVNNASLLIERMYMQRGYHVQGMQKVPDRITLIASQDDAIVGTLTLGTDCGNGLMADENYKAEVDQLRAAGRKVCELTKFAVDQARGSKRVLAGLFHIAYIYGRVLHKHTDVVIEVTPQHAFFYKRMLGFEPFGKERLNSRVNTMGVLLRLEIDYVDRQILEWGGKADSGDVKGVRSLYPYFFSKGDEQGIVKRLLRGDR
ncbi:MAG: N-acyl amino acid synthase FeeM domain-containing protein [Thiobacillaceae bacterium]